jgi:hypothetical protein
MRTFYCIATGFLAAVSFGSGACALTVSQGLAAPAVERAAKPATGVIQIRNRRRAGAIGNWCAYNCYAVPRCGHGHCYGYGHARYPYDEDLPFPYRWDHEASPTDNADAIFYRFTGEPAMRIFERVY